ncbi:MAG: molybdopterin-dependent oxidoreductase [Chloroflexota bacterium]|nr:molybdopterin-dependent oxidoreductase [Chloroflexota bacterium]
MPRRLTNLLLLALVLGLAMSGLLGWVLPATLAWPFWDAHRALGVALLLALLLKLPIAGSSFRRRLPRPASRWSVVPGALAGLSLLGAVVLGLAWTLNLVSFDTFWGYSPLNVHVQLGLLLLPLMAWHAIRRWERRPALPSLVGRRSVLRLAGLAALSTAGWPLLGWSAEARTTDRARRPTGSKHAGSFSANAYPVTIWLFDDVPLLDAETWRLAVVGDMPAPLSVSLAELTSLPPRRYDAVLDCTGGWWSEQTWSGVSVGDLLARAGVPSTAGEAAVVSITGHRWSFPLDELRGALLATHVGGEPLTPGHGYPVRLVVPGRRGFQWIKWVDRIEVA